MNIKVLDKNFTVCKIDSIVKVDFSNEFCFVGKTDEEISLVCPIEYVPAVTVEREDGWRGFKIQGNLDFSLIGILSEISTVLADNQIGIFAISTFNTDYIFTKAENFVKAIHVLQLKGYKIVK